MLNHIISCIKQVFQISSSVKGLLISSFMDWCDAYFLGQICMNSCASEGVKKVWTPLGGQHFLNQWVEGRGLKIFRHLTKGPCKNLIEVSKTKLVVKGGGGGGGSDAQIILFAFMNFTYASAFKTLTFNFQLTF